MQKSESLERIKDEINSACILAGRKTEEILLLAVSKSRPWQDLAKFIELGQLSFGENYIQEATQKQLLLSKYLDQNPHLARPKWHLIGHLQTNKVKQALDFSLIHSIDNFSIAEKLSTYALKLQKQIRALLQINIDSQDSKNGMSPEIVFGELEKISQLKGIQIDGLMCIPNPMAPETQSGATFGNLRKLLGEINKQSCYPYPLKELSMGMSHDFALAIREGATIVRVGTALFGPRK